MQEPIDIARVDRDLPTGFDQLAADAAREGVRNLSLLAADWASRRE